MSTSCFLLHRMLVVFLLFYLTKASGGTCLSYGHSCWGGHGKRNGAAHMNGPSQKHTSGWYLSKLLDPPSGDTKNIEDIFKNQNLDSEEVDNVRRNGYQLYPEPDTQRNVVRRDKGNLEVDTKHGQWDSEGGESEDEIMVLTPEVQRVPVSKLHLFQIMNQGSNKPRSDY